MNYWIGVVCLILLPVEGQVIIGLVDFRISGALRCRVPEGFNLASGLGAANLETLGGFLPVLLSLAFLE